MAKRSPKAGKKKTAVAIAVPVNKNEPKKERVAVPINKNETKKEKERPPKITNEEHNKWAMYIYSMVWLSIASGMLQSYAKKGDDKLERLVADLFTFFQMGCVLVFAGGYIKYWKRVDEEEALEKEEAQQKQVDGETSNDADAARVNS